MKFIFELDRADDMEATMQITMRVHEWKKLKQKLVNEYPTWHLASAISDLLSAADKHFEKRIVDNERELKTGREE